MEQIELVFATNNQNKVNEIRSILKDPFQIITLKEAGIDIDIPEPHDTLEANATEKSTTIHRMTHKNCFSEDTGLEVFQSMVSLALKARAMQVREEIFKIISIYY